MPAPVRRHPMPLSVLVVASECAPLVKVGGLADVVGALPAALRRVGVDARVLLPGYPAVLDAVPDDAPDATVAAWAGLPGARLRAATTAPGVPLYVVDCPSLYVREGTPYADASGAAWPDDARRFGLLAHVAAQFGRAGAPFGFACDVVHANDWQAGLAPAYLALGEQRRAATLFTIHNLAFPGIVDAAWLPALGLPASAFTMHGLEYHGRLAFMKAGLYYADMLSTVSPTYAREITAAPLGMGFEGLLAGRSAELVGILNGIDVDVWNPATDARIAATYDAATLERKAANRAALSHRVGLVPRDDVPLFGLVGRFSGQKGIDLVLDVVDEVAALPAQLVVAGTGEREIEARALEAARRHSGQVAAHVGFDETVAHLIDAGADAVLMPSRFEPCGLNQMYSQRYGTPPIVHATGGLVDSVVDAGDGSVAGGTGFAFTPPTAAALLAAMRRAVRAWHDRNAWRRLQRNGMAHDFGWTASARRYEQAYERAIARKASGV
ncbi:MAG TPA: glycogen synthase GlgA [Casimicrobiaceae bacterium]|nr:glycogen synthase GlgA [Casimicrobiaceae bacterium]